MKEAFISIVIPNYNGEKTLKKCLDSVFNQNYKKFVVIVVDDCSTDNSNKIIKSYHCKFIKLKKNNGPAFARNVGAKNAKGGIILFIDSDVCLKTNTLKLINESFIEYPDASAVVGMPDKFCKFNNISSQHFNLRVYFNYKKMPKQISILYGSVCALRKKAFKDMHGFNTNYKNAGIEDNELGFRLTESGKKIILKKNIQINHYKKVSLLKLLKNDFLRAADRVVLMLRKKKLKNTLNEKRFISTPINQIYSATTIPFLFLSAILYLFSKIGVVVFSLLLIVFYIFNLDYLKFLSKEGGYVFSIKIGILLLIDMFFVDMGLIYGLVQYSFGRRY